EKEKRSIKAEEKLRLVCRKEGIGKAMALSPLREKKLKPGHLWMNLLNHLQYLKLPQMKKKRVYWRKETH
ncbi:hypothetical protein FHG87_024653, partial [Trinorchestia longiramus]